jgi:hypothetical protein
MSMQVIRRCVIARDAAIIDIGGTDQPSFTSCGENWSNEPHCLSWARATNGLGMQGFAFQV